MKKKLTNAAVKALTPLDKPFEVHDTEVKGFLLRVQPSGTMTYYLSYRKNEKITKDSIWRFIEGLNLSDTLKQELKNISPYNYTGIK